MRGLRYNLVLCTSDVGARLVVLICCIEVSLLYLYFDFNFVLYSGLEWRFLSLYNTIPICLYGIHTDYSFNFFSLSFLLYFIVYTNLQATFLGSTFARYVLIFNCTRKTSQRYMDSH